MLEIEGAIARPRLELNLPAEQVADLTRAVRTLESRKVGNRDGWREDEPRELARKIAEYLQAESYLGGRGRRWVEALLQRHAGPPACGDLNRASQDLLRRGASPPFPSSVLPPTTPLTSSSLSFMRALPGWLP